MSWFPPVYPTPGGGVIWSWCWARVFAFASNFVPKEARHGDVFGLTVGDAVEGHLAPSSKYGATVIDRRISPPLRIYYVKCDFGPFRRLTLGDYDFDFRTCPARFFLTRGHTFTCRP